MVNLIAKLKPLDYIIIFLIIFFIILSFKVVKKINMEYVEIISPYKKFTYPLKENKVIKIKGKIGYLTIEIRDKKVRVLKANCPNKICMKTGWIKNSSEYIACVPNGILIKLISKKEAKGNIDFITK